MLITNIPSQMIKATMKYALAENINRLDLGVVVTAHVAFGL